MKNIIGAIVLIIFVCSLVIVKLMPDEKVNTVPTKSITTSVCTTTTTNEIEISTVADAPSLPDDAERLRVRSMEWSNEEPVGPFYFCWVTCTGYEITDTSKIMVDGNGEMFIYGKDAAVIIEEEEQKRAQERQEYENNKNNIKPLFE